MYRYRLYCHIVLCQHSVPVRARIRVHACTCKYMTQVEYTLQLPFDLKVRAKLRFRRESAAATH